MTEHDIVCATPDDSTLTVECRLPSPPERVYRAWTTAADLERWFCPEPTMTAKVRELDVRVGGRYEIAMEGEDGLHVVRGRFLTLEPPHRVEMVWQWEPKHREYPETLVTVEIEGCDGGSRLRLTHAQLDTVESRDAHGEGWTGAVRSLAAWLAQEAPTAGNAR